MLSVKFTSQYLELRNGKSKTLLVGEVTFVARLTSWSHAGGAPDCGKSRSLMNWSAKKTDFT